MSPELKTDIEKIEALVAQVAEEEMVEVFDLNVMREGPRTLIRVFLDREGGIRLGECESFSRKLGAVLDVHDPMPGPYVLEVSSPGLNRKLVKPAHFAAVTGKRVRVALSEPVEGSRNFTGTLVRADEDGFELDREGTTFRFGYGAVRKANLEVSQEELFGKGKRKQ
ncbi:MAG: ribosome maturation factor RimP [Deltaproteobacteria bacterium]|nr:ribosome maturation factor RimP [Deltaproteobacteria bacterium]